MGFRQRLGAAAQVLAKGTADVPLGTIGGDLVTGVMPAGGDPPVRAADQFLQAYSHMPWFSAALRRVSLDVASTQWLLFKQVSPVGEPVRNRILQRSLRREDRKSMVASLAAAGELEQIDQHPLLDLMHRANPIHTGFEARKVSQIHIDAVGESFWVIDRGSRLGVPTSLWPLPPSWVSSTATPTSPWYRIESRSLQAMVPANDMIWFRDTDPANPYGRGSGLGRALGDELETDEYAAKMAKALFYNRARPDMIISPKGEESLTGDQTRSLEERWNRKLRGWARAHLPYFFRRPVDVKVIDQSLRAQQFTQIRDFERNTIFQVFGVSPEILGVITPGSSRATIGESTNIYAAQVQVPRLEFWRQILQERLVPEFDERLFIDYVSPIRKDKERELKAATAAPYGPTVDEWRTMQGLQPLPEGEGGEVHMVPKNLRAVADIGAEAALVPDVGVAPVVEEARGASAERRADLESLDSRSVAPPSQHWVARDVEVLRDGGDWAAAAELEKQQRPGDPDDPPATLIGDTLIKAYLDAQEEAWGALTADVGEVEVAINANREDEVLDAFGGVPAVSDALSDPLIVHGTAAFLLGAELGFNEIPAPPEREAISIGFNDVNPEATAWAEAEAAKLVVDVDAVTQATIRGLIGMANDLGITPRQLARMMADGHLIALLPRQVTALAKFRARLEAQGVPPAKIEARAARFAEAQLRFRALTIARTEIMAALNNGQHAIWQHARGRGVLSKELNREWLVSWDERLEQACENLAGEVVAFNEPFSAGIMVPPLHVSCRCGVGLTESPPDK